jgi:predicted SprT family Zn-dependent metalloprotease
VTRTLNKRIAELAELWSMPDLPASVSVCFSSRLKRSLGRADAARGRIALAAFLADEPALCDLALCHELAHLAAFRMVGSTERPHGPTWQRLVREAGHSPALRIPIGPGDTTSPAKRSGPRFRHVCPVCHFSRTAAKPFSSWRCRDCVSAGLDGHMEIVTVGEPG